MSIIFTDSSDQDLPQIKNLIDAVKGDSDNLKASQFIVARDGDKIIGCVRTIEIDPEFHRMESLAVSPDYRSQGIGGELVRRIIVKDKIRPIYLICFAEREKFYNKNNFEKINSGDLPLPLQAEFKDLNSDPDNQKAGIIAMKLE